MSEPGFLKIFKYGMYILGILLAIIAMIFPTQFGILATEILLVVALLAAILFPTYYAIRHPREALYTFIGIIALAVIFLVGYLIADDSVVMGLQEGVSVIKADATTSKLVSAGLNTFIALFFIAVIGLISTEVMSFFR